MFAEAFFDELRKLASDDKEDHDDRRALSSALNIMVPPFGAAVAGKGKKSRSFLGSVGGGVAGAIGGGTLGALAGGPAGAVLGGSLGGSAGSGIGSYLAHGKYKGKKKD